MLRRCGRRCQCSTYQTSPRWRPWSRPHPSHPLMAHPSMCSSFRSSVPGFATSSVCILLASLTMASAQIHVIKCPLLTYLLMDMVAGWLWEGGRRIFSSNLSLHFFSIDLCDSCKSPCQLLPHKNGNLFEN